MRNNSEINLKIVCFKAFGDLTIALNVINLINNLDDFNLTCVVGNHHYRLVKALNPRCNYSIVNLGSNGVPAYYDIRDSNLIDIIKSLLFSFNSCNKFRRVTNNYYLFDRLGIREYLVFFGMNLKAIDNKYGNIYLNYRECLKFYFPTINKWEIEKGNNRIISIFPGSRKSFRNIPFIIIRSIVNICLDHGFEPYLYEDNHEKRYNINNIKIIYYNSFAESIENINNSCGVISADSFPSHLSSYLKKSVFVLTPYLKTKYWLPVDSFENTYWSLFQDENNIKINLKRFLINLS